MCATVCQIGESVRLGKVTIGLRPIGRFPINFRIARHPEPDIPSLLDLSCPT
jgi:hypothetical protein